MNLPIALLLAATLGAPAPELKRAKDRFEFGAWADCAGTLQRWLATDPPLSDTEAIDAWRMLGISEHHLGDLGAARTAFVNVLSFEPDFALDAFLVPPAVVEFFDRVKRESEPALAPLRERRRALREQQRLADEAKRRLLADEALRVGGGARRIRVQERIYLFNWMPLGAGQFQNGDRAKGTAIASAQIVSGLVNLGAILFHNQIADDRTRLCTYRPGCSNPPYTDSDRTLLDRVDAVKYVSAALFWGVYAWGVYDAHRNFVPIVETEIVPGATGPKALTLRWSF